MTKVTPSIDPRYPFGHCKTNGKVPVVADQAEAVRLATLYRAERERARVGQP